MHDSGAAVFAFIGSGQQNIDWRNEDAASFAGQGIVDLVGNLAENDLMNDSLCPGLFISLAVDQFPAFIIRPFQVIGVGEMEVGNGFAQFVCGMGDKCVIPIARFGSQSIIYRNVITLRVHLKQVAVAG